MLLRKLKAVAVLLLLSAILTGCSGKEPDFGWEEPARAIVDPDTGTVYLRERVFVPSGPHLIASTLLRPDTSARVPAMVVVSGSQGGILTAESPLHRRVAASGVAVLVLGKKGAGPSSGDWRDETFHDRAGNVKAALDWLAGRDDIEAGRTILYGHSQGGYVIPLVSGDPRVAGLVLAAAPVEPVRDQIWTDRYEAYVREGMSVAEARAKADSDQKWLDLLLSGCGLASYHYLCRIYDFDPEPHLASISEPVLALFGENDPMVPPGRNLDRMRELLGGSADARIVLLPEANHMFWESANGSTDEYPDLVGPPARFPLVIEGDADHTRLAELSANRVKYSAGYFEAVEDFVGRHAGGQVPFASVE